LRILKKLSEQENKQIIIITHNMDHVLSIADQVLLLDQKKLIFEGDPFTFFQNKELIKKTELEMPTVINFLHKLENYGLDTST
jgi:energy-coupling factor transport system ATP-binding protein